MRGAGDGYTVGERVAFYRARRGLTQSVLAGLVGRSEDWLSKVERGERQVRRLDVLSDLARALRVSLPDLVGQPVLLEDEQRQDDVPAVRDALMAPRRLSRLLYGPSSVKVPPAAAVLALVEHSWDDYQAGRVGRVVAALPALIGTATQLEDLAPDAVGSERSLLWAVSARTHHLAATTLASIGESDLAWLAAERAMQAADRSGDPLVLASAARAGTHALLSVGRFDEALDLGRTAETWLRDRMRDGDPEALSLVGMLALRTAIAAARRQDRSAASELLDEAGAAASRLGRDANHWKTSFGPTNVELHRVAAALDLGDVEYVADRGPLIEAPAMPTERRVMHKIAVARALSLMARDDEAVSTLLDAEGEAPQLVRHNATARETVKNMHRRARRSSVSSTLAGLAERCRAVA